MNNNKNYEEIFGSFTSNCDKMDAMCKQYMECIYAFCETNDVFMLTRTFSDLKALLQRTECGIDHAMYRINRFINNLGVHSEPSNGNSPQILSQEEIEALLK